MKMKLALILSVIAGFANVIGGFLSTAKKANQKILDNFIAVSSGFILAVTLLDLYPEVIEESANGPLLILVGFVAIFVLDNFFAVHAHKRHEDHDHSMMAASRHGEELEKHSVWAAWVGFMIHTFFDGAAIAARLLVSPVSGVLVFIAVLSHKIPEGFSVSSIFQAAKFSRTKAFLAAASLGLSTVIGAFVVFVSGHSEFSLVFLALATGSFTYITASELIPYVSGTKSRYGVVLFLFGVVLFYVSSHLLSKVL